jgi:hypothetical protein
MIQSRRSIRAHSLARVPLVLVLVLVIGGAAMSHARADEVTYARRMACASDVFRFCASALPDPETVKVCMIANKARLSAACQAMFPKAVADR